jgi:hypothetical protein
MRIGAVPASFEFCQFFLALEKLVERLKRQ